MQCNLKQNMEQVHAYTMRLYIPQTYFLFTHYIKYGNESQINSHDSTMVNLLLCKIIVVVWGFLFQQLSSILVWVYPQWRYNIDPV